MPSTVIDHVRLKKHEDIEIFLPNGFAIYVYGDGTVEVENYARSVRTKNRRDYVSETVHLVARAKKAEKKSAKARARELANA